MPLAKQKLRILTFPQRIAGRNLELNVLVLPTQRLLNDLITFESQLNPGSDIQLPKFINADLQLQIKTIRGLSSYPFSEEFVLDNEGVKADTFPTDIAFPANMQRLYEGLESQFEILPSGAGLEDPKDDANGIRKYLPLSYRAAFNFTTPRTEFAKTDDSYQCAIKCAPKPDLNFGNSSSKVPWGRVIGFCLRQPLLAEKIGLLHHFTLELPSANYFADGGWVYFDLIAPLSFDITPANAEIQLRQYAARIPAIDRPRQLFGALLFPVVKGPFQPNGEYDALKIEAADYDDGFAKIVHAFQPVSANLLAEEPDGIHVQRDAGIRLGWDDEQILIWQNRQLLADPNTPNQRIEAPLGVFSYRVDVREKTTPASDWASLVEVRNKAQLQLGGEVIAPAQTRLETGVQVFPSQINADPQTHFWLPSFFTQWYGASLVLPDARAAQLDASGALEKPELYSDKHIDEQPKQKSGLYEAVLPANPELKYGKQYEFRVRLADLTGGGPRLDERELNDAPATHSLITFKRFVAPKQLTVDPVDFVPDPASRTSVFYPVDSFEISRPRLGYPALLFTQMDTAAAFAELEADRDFLHDDLDPLETIKEQREVSYFDPDVDKFMVRVEIKSLAMDNAESTNQREAYIPLYTTFRSFDPDPETPFTLELEYRNANVINFGNEIDLGDLNLSKVDIDGNDVLVLPRSRDIRITLLPVCSDKPAVPAYFGFAKTRFGDELVRCGEPIQFFVREDAEEEADFFRTDLESRQLRGLYLQPDQPQVNNPVTFFKEMVAGKELQQSPLIQRLAAQLDLGFNGMSLIGKPGERVQFGCSNRIRHTLAPDNSSITFATSGDLINHWLCVLSFEIARDWTWDGLSDPGIEVRRTKRFTGENGTTETAVVGHLELKRTANRIAINDPDRSYTRVVFIDAVEPKKDLTKPSTTAAPFPNTIDVSYSLRPDFIKSVNAPAEVEQTEVRDITLPVTTKPAQVPKVVAAGVALSPYVRSDDYSETAVRQRYLWFEFEKPIADPNDTYFARVLSYAPDPLLTFRNVDQLFVKQDDPPLAIDPELVRVITHDHGNDNAGIDAMQEMMAETGEPQALVKVSPVHYLLPLPPGLHHESNELFGFFVYELRVGHSNKIWSTAQGRFGHPIRVNGVQHPAPPLKCLVDRTSKGISVTAHYATSVFNGRNVTSKPPKTEIWCMLYAQLRQADGNDNRNILLSEKRLDYLDPDKVPRVIDKKWPKLLVANSLMVNLDAPATGVQSWTEAQIKNMLSQFNLSPDTRLSVLAVEMMPRYDQYIIFGQTPSQSVRPLSQDLGQYRILRTSRLVKAPPVC